MSMLPGSNFLLRFFLKPVLTDGVRLLHNCVLLKLYILDIIAGPCQEHAWEVI